jgi:hypothetical protein
VCSSSHREYTGTSVRLRCRSLSECSVDHHTVIPAHAAQKGFRCFSAFSAANNVIVAAHRLKTLSQSAIRRTKEGVRCDDSVAERTESSVIIEPWNEPQWEQKIKFAGIDSPQSRHRSQDIKWCPICSCFGLDGMAPCSPRPVCGRVLRPDADLVAVGRSIPCGPGGVFGAKSGA